MHALRLRAGEADLPGGLRKGKIQFQYAILDSPRVLEKRDKAPQTTILEHLEPRLHRSLDGLWVASVVLGGSTFAADDNSRGKEGPRLPCQDIG